MKKQAVRNWPLVVTAVVVIVLNLALLVVAILCLSSIGWWAIVLILGASTAIASAIMAIRTNEPAWLLLELLFPS